MNIKYGMVAIDGIEIVHFVGFEEPIDEANFNAMIKELHDDFGITEEFHEIRMATPEEVEKFAVYGI